MRLNADFSVRVAVHAGAMPWVASPIMGVDRRMLDRVGDEVARATSIVRYAPGSRFSAHTHGGGEEFLVLDGVFQDEHGDFPAGAYIRNPPTTHHTPGSALGCTIFVKLWQFDPADRNQLRLGPDTETASGPTGVTTRPLFSDAQEQVRIEHWAPGTTVRLAMPGGIELLVLSGGFTEGGEEFMSQSWLRLPDGAALAAVAGIEGARVWIKTGHLSAAALERTRPGAVVDGATIES